MSDVNQRLLVAQLLAAHDTLQATCAQIRASLIALGVDVDALLDGAPAHPVAPCPHPADAIEDLASTFGAVGPFRCTACGAEQDQPFSPSDSPDSPTPSED